MLGKFITDGPNLSIPVFVIFIKECRFKKSLTDKPEENLAAPEVGKTWLDPAIITHCLGRKFTNKD